jgi:signal transduction histidine kinase
VTEISAGGSQRLRQIIEIQDRERALVACDLHDGLLQQLVAAQMLLEAAVARHGQGSSTLLVAELDRVQQLLSEAIAVGRQMVHQLQPFEVADPGIVAALRTVVDRQAAIFQMQIDFTAPNRDWQLPPRVQGSICRMVQQALFNVKQHAGVDRAHLRLSACSRELKIEVEDCGAGFARDRVTQDRCGLEGIRRRARLMGGTATIRSSPGQGTLVTICVPLNSGRNTNETDDV